MTWTQRTFGTAKAPAFESDCHSFDVVQKKDGTWRLIYTDVTGVTDYDYIKDFPTAEAAKAYAESQGD